MMGLLFLLAIVWGYLMPHNPIFKLPKGFSSYALLRQLFFRV